MTTTTEGPGAPHVLPASRCPPIGAAPARPRGATRPAARPSRRSGSATCRAARRASAGRAAGTRPRRCLRSRSRLPRRQEESTTRPRRSAGPGAGGGRRARRARRTRRRRSGRAATRTRRSAPRRTGRRRSCCRPARTAAGWSASSRRALPVPTRNVNAPSTGCVSAEITRHVTTYVPAPSFGRLACTVDPSPPGCSGVPESISLPCSSYTRTVPSFTPTDSPKCMLTERGADATENALPFAGFVPSSTACGPCRRRGRDEHDEADHRDERHAAQ